MRLLKFNEVEKCSIDQQTFFKDFESEEICSIRQVRISPDGVELFFYDSSSPVKILLSDIKRDLLVYSVEEMSKLKDF